jgi:hypothetical protein
MNISLTLTHNRKKCIIFFNAIFYMYIKLDVFQLVFILLKHLLIPYCFGSLFVHFPTMSFILCYGLYAISYSKVVCI